MVMAFSCLILLVLDRSTLDDGVEMEDDDEEGEDDESRGQDGEEEEEKEEEGEEDDGGVDGLKETLFLGGR